ncbi:bifunctional AP-4-A phosphorylase/ADP sulfurylase [Mycoemilia scoparia]|uniref:Bifunctional AP-4-A phosphorylase/ADP sulfurylase n=1 Tax=Mycoemilia scoparia TaxID=417184 RepID=A0A9W7ZX56_9FUNG|nr:bifunctional AP-4-A phosphorylase/ADP sulfurylase [Mycoemilia scoparia]
MTKLDQRITETYLKALDSKHLLYFESKEISFQIRLCPALASKPDIKLNEHKKLAATDPTAKKVVVVNPFKPYDPKLYVEDLGDSHILLLNKFCVVPNHTLIVTKQFREQGERLSIEDFNAVVSAVSRQSCPLIAFYNSGPESGASQPHKHLQLLPFDNSWKDNNSLGENGRVGQEHKEEEKEGHDSGVFTSIDNRVEKEEGEDETKSPQPQPLVSDADAARPPIIECFLASNPQPDKVTSSSLLPFLHYGVKFDPQVVKSWGNLSQTSNDTAGGSDNNSVGFESLSKYLVDVYERILELVDHDLQNIVKDNSNGGNNASSAVDLETDADNAPSDKVDRFSYNFIMTRECMFVVPRKHNAWNNVGMNSLGAAGLMICKNNQNLEEIRVAGPLTILKSIGFPKF